jgi:hypothetical protein
MLCCAVMVAVGLRGLQLLESAAAAAAACHEFGWTQHGLSSDACQPKHRMLLLLLLQNVLHALLSPKANYVGSWSTLLLLCDVQELLHVLLCLQLLLLLLQCQLEVLFVHVHHCRMLQGWPLLLPSSSQHAAIRNV